MIYNWQQKDWPNFTYDLSYVNKTLDVFIEKVGHQKGLLIALNSSSKEDAIIEILVSESIKTSEIENEYLSRQDVTSSIKYNLGLYEPGRGVRDLRAKGIGKMMVDVRNNYRTPLTESALKDWHKTLFLNQNHIVIGEWRSHKAPMQVVSDSLHKPKVHFQAPPSVEIPNEMMRFLDWFSSVSNNKKGDIKYAPVFSAISHIFFESIHPFEDGNGRIGRAIADKALSMIVDYPLLLSLSTIIENKKKDYYTALERNQKSNDITDWINYFVNVVVDAQIHTEEFIKFIIKKVSFHDKFKNKMNQRQQKCVNRMFEEGSKGFKGGMSAKKYMSVVKTSKATATRDLQALEGVGAFTVQGGGRSTRYHLNLDQI